MFKRGGRISVKVYRAESGYTHPRGTTVLDVIHYEENELGNDIGYQHLDDEFFSKIPAKYCCWVTLKRKDALRYGRDIISWVIEDAIVLGVDGEGGYLIVQYDNTD